MKIKASNFLQIYSMGDEDKEVDRRCQIVGGLNENLTLQYKGCSMSKTTSCEHLKLLWRGCRMKNIRS